MKYWIEKFASERRSGLKINASNILLFSPNKMNISWGEEGAMKTKFTDDFNPTKTRAHSRVSNAPLLVTEPFLPKTVPGDVSRRSRPLPNPLGVEDALSEWHSTVTTSDERKVFQRSGETWREEGICRFLETFLGDVSRRFADTCESGASSMETCESER